MANNKEWLKEKMLFLEEQVKNNRQEIEKLKKELQEKTENKSKNKSKKTNIQITDTDVILFRYLFENKFLAREHIGEYIYSSLDYANQRLSKLTKTRYVKKLPHPLRVEKKTTYIMPTNKALSYLKSNVGKNKLKSTSRLEKLTYLSYLSNHYEVIEEPPIGNFEHDNQLNKLRFELENMKATNWRTKHMINSTEEGNIRIGVPDAIFSLLKNNRRCGTIDNNCHKIGLELEKETSKKKNYEDYMNLFSNYFNFCDINYLLYVTDNFNVYKKIELAISQGCIKSVDANKLIFVDCLEDVLGGKSKVFHI